MQPLFSAPDPKVSPLVITASFSSNDDKLRATKLRLITDVKIFWARTSALTASLEKELASVSAQFAEPTEENPILYGFSREQKLALFGDDAKEIAARKAKVEQALALLKEATAYKA
jgi:hypothetical protein